MTDQRVPALLRPAAKSAVLTVAEGLNEDAVARTLELVKRDRAPSTLAAYAKDWDLFQSWCRTRQVDSLPAVPQVVAIYIADHVHAGLSVSLLVRRLAAVRYHHERAGHQAPNDHPLVKSATAAARRTAGRPPEKAEPLLAPDIKGLAPEIPGDLKGKRDKALLLLAFAAALRRSEVVALQVEDVKFVREGIRLLIRRSKGDQEGKGQFIPVPAAANLDACPVKAVREWMRVAGLSAGPLFRRLHRGNTVGWKALHENEVGRILKRHLAEIGEDPAAYSAHSLRAGFLTSAAMAGKPIHEMQRVSRHKQIDTLMGYVRVAEEFANPAGAGLLD